METKKARTLPGLYSISGCSSCSSLRLLQQTTATIKDIEINLLYIMVAELQGCSRKQGFPGDIFEMLRVHMIFVKSYKHNPYRL